MRMRQLECFLRVVETGSITKAAEQLNIAQPALGTMITALEKEVGAKLLVRRAVGTSPTPAGLLFAEEAEHILKRLGAVKRRLAEMEGASLHAISVGLTPSLAGTLAASLVQALRETVPDVAIRLYEELSHNLAEQVDGGKLTIALAFNVPESARLLRRAILREPLYLVAGPGSPLASDDPIELAALEAVDFALPSEKDLVRRLFVTTMAEHGMAVRIAYEIESMQTIRDLVQTGKVCGIVPYATVSREAATGGLVARRIANPAVWRTLYLIRRRGEPGYGEMEMRVEAAIRAFMENVKTRTGLSEPA